jgi:hypothetical protein
LWPLPHLGYLVHGVDRRRLVNVTVIIFLILILIVAWIVVAWLFMK